MSTFYGTVQGHHGEAARCGTRDIETTAASWHGAIQVQISGSRSKADQHISIRAVPWQGTGPNGVIFSGSWEELAEALTEKTILRSDLNVLEDVAALHA